VIEGPIAAPLVASLKVSAAAMILGGPLAIAVAWFLSRSQFPGKAWLSAVVGLPLVLPPTAVGYLLLRSFTSDVPILRDAEFLFTWRAAALAAAVMSLPLVVRTARATFDEIDPRYDKMARTLGFGPFAAFLLVVVPLARRGLIGALVLGFTRALGECFHPSVIKVRAAIEYHVLDA